MNRVPRRLLCLRWALLAAGVVVATQLSAGDAPSTDPPGVAWAWTGDAASLHRLSLAELDYLYAQGTVTSPPVGYLPGEVITFTNMRAPKLVKRMADRHWMGKHIEPDGYFINQWRHGQRLASHLTIGPSYTDGNPCLVFEYPRWTPLFGPMRDEYREIAPGLFLGRMYRRVPCVKFLGFNYLQLSGTSCCQPTMLQQTPPNSLPTPNMGQPGATTLPPVSQESPPLSIHTSPPTLGDRSTSFGPTMLPSVLLESPGVPVYSPLILGHRPKSSGGITLPAALEESAPLPDYLLPPLNDRPTSSLEAPWYGGATLPSARLRREPYDATVPWYGGATLPSGR